MTHPPAILLRGVSKKYQLYDSLGHRVYEALHPFRKRYHREFWALRDIDLEIPPGATVGILGVNGSGKSTLLQIICSILQPTSGAVEVLGRVAALIELGAGFNPELTGRENAEINCTVMGLDASAVRARLPIIEEFADIGEFFDQPVRIYSSGMFMRVAFATAISVDPDVLVIDEALAVGDAKFQQKCFRKFRDFQSAGKTILLVTHDRSAVPRLCSYGVVLHRGGLVYAGSPKEATDCYSHILTHGEVPRAAHGVSDSNQPFGSRPLAASAPESDAAQRAIANFLALQDAGDRCPGNPTYNRNEFTYGLGGAAIVDFLVAVAGAINPVDVQSGSSVDIYVRVRYDRAVVNPLVGFSVKARDGTLAYGTHSGWLGKRFSDGVPQRFATYRFTVMMDLGADDWFIDLAVAATQTEVLHTREGVIHLRTIAPMISTGIVTLRTDVAELG